MTATTLRSWARSQIARNIVSLYATQIANYLLPLISIPYLVRTLGPEGYGTYAFAQGFMGYLTVITDYGFNLSATREISANRDRADTVNEVASAVIAARLLLTGLSLGILLAVMLLVPKFQELRLLLTVLFVGLAGQAMVPLWLYQGMEQLPVVTAATVVNRLLFTVGVFVVVRQPDDYVNLAVFHAVLAIATGMITLWLGIRMFRLAPRVPTMASVVRVLREGWVLFLSSGSTTLYTVGNSFVLGLVTGKEVVGYYAAAEKLARAAQGLLGPVSQALYPRFSRLARESTTKTLYWARRVLLLQGALGLSISLTLAILSPAIVVSLMGSTYERSIGALRILSLLPWLVGMSNVLGIQLMVPLGMDRLFTGILFAAGLVNVLLAVWLAPIWLEQGMALAVALSEAFVVVSMAIVLRVRGVQLTTPLQR